MKRKILIDCDPGIDDMLALLFLESQKQLEIAAVTTSFGSSSAETTFENGKGIAAVLGMDAVIACGAQNAIINGSGDCPVFTRGKDPGILGFKGNGKNVSDRHAWDVIYDMAVREEGQLEIITLGPLTNLATALLKYEDLKDRIKSLTVMGGSAGIGDVIPFGEANVLWDPYAFQVVLQSGISRIVMAGLDVLEHVRLTEEEFTNIFHRENLVSSRILPLLKQDKDRQMESGDRTIAAHAAAAAAAVAFPELVETEPYHVAVELAQNGQYGRTVVDTRLHATAERNVNVVRDMDRGKFIEHLLEAWISYQ